MLTEMQAHLDQFHYYRTVFITTGVREDLNPPRQHALRHYIQLVQDFGASNGVCSSITESAHIRAIKKPWRRSSRFRALGQMLLTNQRLDKLTTARSDFEARGMLSVPVIETVDASLQTQNGCESSTSQSEDDEDLPDIFSHTSTSHTDNPNDINDSDSDDYSDTESYSDSDSDSTSEDNITSVATLAARPCKFLTPIPE